MNPPVVPGRVNLITDQEDALRELAERMNYAGFSAALYRDLSQDNCTLSVPADQEDKARLYLNDYFTASSEARKEEDMANYRNAAQTDLPQFLSAMEKMKDKSNSAFFFLFGGVLLLAVSHTETVTERGQTTAYLLLGILFLIFGIHTFVKAHELKNAAGFEQDFMKKVSEWFFAAYSAEELDQFLSSCMGSESFAALTGDSLRDVRLSAIRDYIGREFCISDADWLNWLSDNIYARCYQLAGNKMMD